MGNTDIVVSRIEIALSKDQIDLSNLQLEEVPEQLRSLINLKRINISSNHIKSLPDWFQEMSKLETLDLRNCQIESLCNGFEKLHNLTNVYLRNNNLSEVPLQFQFMPNLKVVFLGNNKIEKFPDWFFQIESVSIDGNPIIDPPVEVYHRGTQAVINYFKEREKGSDILNEAKLLIVGEPGAGKTTLMNKIINEDFPMTLYLPSTKGIEIQTFYFQTEKDNNFRVNIWDFGGQEIYHATHQFFLTKRSLYILLSDNRAEDTDFNYWLRTIELLSDNSPIIIIQNEKQDRKKDINEKGMREKFKVIKSIVSFNIASQKTKLRSLLSNIKTEIAGLSHIGTELPKVWVDIRKALEERAKNVPYINEQEYFDICSHFGMKEKERANFLSDYLHDLGVFLHFKDNPVLKRWIILRPDWGTEAVYKVLDNEKVILEKGYFTREDLKSIWDSSVYSDMHEELISLMKMFELCYQLEGENTLIAAQLLERDKPLYNWNRKNNLNVKYQYGFMPKGIITRFIVKMHYYIVNQDMVWREGVLLERQNTKAEIIETYGEKEIQIRVEGRNKKEFLAVILDTLDKIHASYTNLKVSKLIPCNCKDCIISESPFNFNYNEVRRFVDAGISEDRCRISLINVKLLSLIDDAFGISQIMERQKPLIYLSYANSNKLEKNQLEKHLKSIEKNGDYELFDREKISAGMNERKVLRENIDIADVVLLLISANYINDEWCYYSEMMKAIDRSDTGSCLTIPIIITDCNWELLPIQSFKPITYKGKPLFSNSIIDESLSSAVYDIKSSIDAYVSRKNKIGELKVSQDLINYQNKRDNQVLEDYLK
jgi:internalin A